MHVRGAGVSGAAGRGYSAVPPPPMGGDHYDDYRDDDDDDLPIPMEGTAWCIYV